MAKYCGCKIHVSNIRKRKERDRRYVYVILGAYLRHCGHWCHHMLGTYQFNNAYVFIEKLSLFVGDRFVRFGKTFPTHKMYCLLGTLVIYVGSEKEKADEMRWIGISGLVCLTLFSYTNIKFLAGLLHLVAKFRQAACRNNEKIFNFFLFSVRSSISFTSIHYIYIKVRWCAEEEEYLFLMILQQILLFKCQTLSIDRISNEFWANAALSHCGWVLNIT